MHKNFISISYSSLDILFPNELIEASMYAGDDKTDFTTHSVEYKNERAVYIFIDKIITSLFSCSQGGHAYTALLFSKPCVDPGDAFCITSALQAAWSSRHGGLRHPASHKLRTAVS